MLNGIDVSRWNDVNLVKKELEKNDFIFIKATEGNIISDTKQIQFANMADSMHKVKGFYHYARPEINENAESEAYFFLSRIAPYIGDCLIALDWEGAALNYNINWALEWLECIRYCTGSSPVIYTQGSYTKNLQPILDHKFNLWVAHWGVDSPNIGVYPFYAFWQYESTNIDKNLFNGDLDQLRALM